MAPACVSCDAESEPGARFCSACGAPLSRECPGCGAEQPAAAAFCSACGLALREGHRRAAAAGEREERRIVTVLFADLAGSTALAERLDPEDVRSLQEELFELVNDEVERFGGTTEKFVGDAVMAVFGVPQAHEDDPERAVRAALAVRDAFPAFAARLRERHGAEVGLRLGVNTGEVVAGREAAARGELMVSGDAVNVAARLQQHAEPGEVLVGARTHRATRRSVAYRARGGIDAKGKRAPVEGWTALSVAGELGRRGVEGLSAPIVGRDEELAVLSVLAGRTRRERAPQLVTLLGPAGVGKSRLLAELVDRLPDVRLLEGRCLPYGDGITYWPLAEVAKSHAGVLETDPADVALAKLRAAVAGVVPGEEREQVVEALAWTIGLALPGLVPTGFASSDVRARLHGAWARYVAALGRERPTVLAIDDIHWASEPLLDLLEHLVDTLDDTPVLIICPARAELLDTRPGWGAGKRNAMALTLAPLLPEESGRLLSELLRADRVVDDARRRILERAEGNPFYLEEILRMLIEQGILERRDGDWTASERLAELPLPDSVHGVIAARIDLLDAAGRDALRRCSVMGRVFWPTAVGVDVGLVESLARRGLVSEQPTSVMAGRREFAFKHALIQDVAYGTLPRGERRELHRRVGEWVQDLAPDRAAEAAELTAYHLVQAIDYGEDEPAVVARAFACLLDAGEAALARAALPSAETLLTRALELAPSDRDRGQALVALARQDLGRQHYGRALERLHAARETAAALGDARLEADVLGWTARVCWLAGRWEDAAESAATAVAMLEGLPESRELARALARRSQIEMLRGHHAAEEHALEAIEVARRVADLFAEVNGRTNLFTSRAMRGVPPDEAEMHDLIERAIEAAAYDEAFRVVVNFIWSAAPFTRLEQLEAMVANALARLSGVHGIESYGQYIALSLAKFVWIPAGRWEEIEPALPDPDNVLAGGNRILWLEVVAGMALRLGNLAVADELVPELRERAIESGEPQRILPMASVVLSHAALTGGRATLQDVVGTVLALTGGRWAMLAAAAVPRALLAAGEVDLLRRFDDALAGGRAAEGYVPSVVQVSRGLRALADGRADEAVELLAELVSLERERGAIYDAACLELDLARGLEARGDVEGAAAARERARAVLDPLGCANPF